MAASVGKLRQIVKNASPSLKAAGHALFVGEGNLSYALDAVRRRKVDPNALVASVYEPQEEALKKYDGMGWRVKELERKGVKVLFGIDATKLSEYPEISANRYGLIQWNHPHHATADSSNIKENQELISKFLKQAQKVLQKDGNVDVLLRTDFPFGDADENKDAAENKEDVSAENKEDVSAEKEEDVFVYAEYVKGWNITSLANDSGLIFIDHENFDYREHVDYHPSKGFGENPNTDWAKGVSRVYQFKMDPNLQSPKK